MKKDPLAVADSHSFKPLALGLVPVVSWGASFIATKVLLRELPGGAIVWLRFGVGTMVLAAFAVGRGERLAVPVRTLASFAFLGFLGIAFHQWLQINGLVTAKASTAAWIITTTPVFIALLGRFVLREVLGLFRAAGIAVAAFGVLLVVSGGDIRALFLGETGTTGDLLVLASAVNWAVFSVISRRILKKQSPTVAMLYVMTAGWLFSSVLLPAPSGLWNGLVHLSPSGWWCLAFLGPVCSGVAYVFWYDALKVLPAARVGALLYIEPLVAMAVAVVVLGEPVHTAALGGGFLILGGVWMVNRRPSH